MEEVALKEKTCCFTGHRIVPKAEEVKIIEHIDLYVRTLTEKDVKYFLVGGAIGFDTLAAHRLFYLRDTENLDIKVIMILKFV